jgi:hypothetical protein
VQVSIVTPQLLLFDAITVTCLQYKRTSNTITVTLDCVYGLGAWSECRSDLLQWCYSGVTSVLQWCHIRVALVLHFFHIGITMLLQWCCSGVTVVLQWCCTDVALVLQCCSSAVELVEHGFLHGCHTGVTVMAGVHGVSAGLVDCFDIICLLPAFRCLLSAVCCLLSVVCCLLSAVC